MLIHYKQRRRDIWPDAPHYSAELTVVDYESGGWFVCDADTPSQNGFVTVGHPRQAIELAIKLLISRAHFQDAYRAFDASTADRMKKRALEEIAYLEALLAKPVKVEYAESHETYVVDLGEGCEEDGSDDRRVWLKEEKP